MKRELVATVADSEIDLVVETREDGLWRVVIDGREHVVDALPVRPGTWSVLIDGRSRVIDLDARGPRTALLAAHTETLVTLEDARRKRLARAVGGRAGAGAGGMVRAPIAGKVVKMLVSEGDVVEAGQGVAVLEAMKMENEIRADRDGTVTAVHVEPGKSVETQEPLVTLS